MALPGGTNYDLATVTNPGSALTDFTLWVDLSRMSADWWSAVDTADGTKGRAAIHASGTEVACDWIDFDNIGQTGFLRVKWSGTLSSSGTQQLRIYPPNTGNSSYAPSDTYGSDNVYGATDEGHYPIYGDSGSPLTDRTSNGNDATWADADITISADKLTFANTHDGVSLMSGKPLDGGSAFTIMGRFLASDLSADRGIFYTEDHTGSDPLLLWFDNAATDHIAALINTSSGGGAALYSGLAASVSTEYHIALTWDGSTLRLYINGVEDTTGSFPYSISGTLDVSAASNYYFGDDRGSNKDFQGTMRDLWVKSGSVSSAWANEEYSQINDNSSFWGVWAWQGGAGGTTPKGVFGKSIFGPFGGPI